MTLRNARPIRFSPRTLSDAIDATDVNPGPMAKLINLIPDPTTADVWTCRPAHEMQTSFSSFTAPGAVSVFKVIGSLVYGLVASTRFAGHDEPFCYDLRSRVFVTVMGVTAANTPVTQATTGDWTPPTADLCGVNLVVTHPGFDGVTNFFGWFNTSSPSAPVWNAGNTTGLIILTNVPAWVAQFNGRAYLGINPPTGQPSVVFTDPLTLNVTNANQALTFGDNLPLTAAKGLPLSNQLGGVVQALLVFKGTNNVQQVTGDAAQSNLSINSLNVATGTLAPWSIVTSPLGVMFMSPDGIRYIDFDARVSAPIGAAGAGVNVPFINALYPTRACAACTAEVLRVSVFNAHASGAPLQDYWYDLVRQVWSGPHTFPATCLDTYMNSFIVSAPGLVGLYSGEVTPTTTSGVIENGAQLSWVWETAPLSDDGQMAMSEVAEMQIKTSAVSGVPTMTVTAQDENGTPYATATYTFAIGPAALWGAFNWGQGLWGGQSLGLAARRVDFNAPVVFNRLAVHVTGASTAGFRIGDMLIRQRTLGYMQVGP